MAQRNPPLKTWNVRVHRNGVSTYLGTVQERNEELARCAALSQLGRTDDEPVEAGIGPDDDFDVSPASI